MAIKRKTPNGTAKGVSGSQQYSCTGCAWPRRKVLSSNGSEASGALSRGAAKAVGTEVADILQ